MDAVKFWKMKKKFEKPKILILCDYYLPGYKSGGGMRTIVNMIDRLHHLYDFRVITRDHDGKLDRRRYETVGIDRWNEIRNAQVFYLSKDSVKSSKIRELVLTVEPDLIYTNSYFATLTIYALKLRRLKLIPDHKIVIAPCGELSEGALQLKSSKKRIFINLAKLTGLYKNVVWKASSELESGEIDLVRSKRDKVFIAPDLPPRSIFPDFDLEKKPGKKPGTAKMIFLSRFMKKKNFKWLLENLQGIRGRLVMDIYGPMEDPVYWAECAELIERLPDNIKIEAKGPVSHDRVLETLFQYHFFVMPTLGENFGHIFLEALAAGCPLLISDRTPWRELEINGIGWDLSLDQPAEWIDVINRCISQDEKEFKAMAAAARQFVSSWLSDEEVERNTLKVLEYGLNKRLSDTLTQVG